MKLFEKIRINFGKSKEREIRILDIPVFQYGRKEENGYSEKYFKLFPRSFEDKILNKLNKKIPNGYDGIFLIRVNAIGETYLFQFCINELIRKHNIKSPLVVTHYQAARDVCKIFNPNIEVLIVEDITVKDLSYLQNRSFKYKNKCFFLIPNTLKEAVSYYTRISNDSSLHYADEMLQKIGCENYHLTGVQNFEKGIKNSVLLIKEANSVMPISADFWNKLTQKLKEKGYKVVVNSSEYTIEEMYELASQVKAIISLRCGFVELFSSFPQDKHILYTPRKFNPVSSKNMLDCFSLKKYPFVDKNTVFEYDVNKFEEDDLVKNIISKFQEA